MSAGEREVIGVKCPICAAAFVFTEDCGGVWCPVCQQRWTGEQWARIQGVLSRLRKEQQ